MTTLEQVPDGGPQAAVLMEEEPATVEVRRLWLVPLLLLAFLLAPLLRDGIPATQAGVLPLYPSLASTMLPPLALPFVVGGAAGYKLSLALHMLAAMLAVGWLAWALWGRLTAWWVAALWLTLPLPTSLTLQGGWLHPLQGIILLAAGGIVFLSIKSSLRLLALVLWAWGASLLWTSQPALEPSQLFSSAWPSPDNPREWVGGMAYGLGLVPFALALLAALAAWPRRDEAGAKAILVLALVALVSVVLTFFGGPVLLFLAVASLAMVLAAGGLPILDVRYASFPVLLALLVISALAIYPALRPAWLDEVPDSPNVVSFVGDSQFLLLDVRATREGKTTIVEATWQATRLSDRDYSVFVHLLDAQSNIVAQADTLLLDPDEVPSSRWPVGYLVRQSYRATGAEAAQARLGLYDVETLQRLLFADGTDSVTVPLP
ncbi:MAG TPA: hypothetical protein VF707_09210 [Ardenticatenaceae bacterium]|jgi:hypothetical protein